MRCENSHEGSLVPEPSSRSFVDTHRNVHPHDRCEWSAPKNRSVVTHRAVSSPRLKPGASTANTSGDCCHGMSAADAVTAALILGMSTISRHQAGATVAGEKTGGQFKASEQGSTAASVVRTGIDILFSP